MYSPDDAERFVRLRRRREDNYRTAWRRDYGRVIHSPAFRRLQGKTQLFPGIESDFFRNRLTHSLEAAQIAKAIATRLNSTEKFLQDPKNKIEPDIAEIAALCHDLGHPPFGHNGEKALDECMKKYGGFEGNAQTLRILVRLEKRENISEHPTGIDDSGRDLRCGLNLTARVLASVLKYDNEIPFERKPCDALEKGYYQSERDVVQWVKQQVVARLDFGGKFKTVECQIMDIADDIAYSTYDLEDALKAKFFLPLDAIAASQEILEEVSQEVSKPGALGVRFTQHQVKEVLNGIFGGVARLPPGKKLAARRDLAAANVAYRTSLRLANDGHLRVEFSSELVRKFINAVRLKPNADAPALSQVYLVPGARMRVEVLKRFNFISLIMSPRLKVAEFRGGDIVKTIFEALADQSNDGHRLLPDDFRMVFERVEQHQRRRVICDFIAGMTDRYALEFYGRLKSENPQTIFKPL